MLGHEVGILCRELLEATEDDTLGQCCLGQSTIVEGVVHHEVERGAHVGHVALEHVVGVYGDVETIDVHSIVGSEERLHIGIFIVLNTPGGEALLLQMAAGLITQRIHHLAAMTGDEIATLTVEGEVLSLSPRPPPKGGGLLTSRSYVITIVYIIHIYMSVFVTLPRGRDGVGLPYSSTSFLIQSKPRFSISSANSGPAVFTMRPL